MATKGGLTRPPLRPRARRLPRHLAQLGQGRTKRAAPTDPTRDAPRVRCSSSARQWRKTCHPALSAVFPTSGGLFQPSGTLMQFSTVAMCKQPEPRSPQSASTSALEADCSALVSNYTCTPRSDDSTYYFTAQEAQRAARGTIREKRYDLSHPGVHHTWRARSAAASWLIDSRTCGGFGGSPGFSQLINRTVRGPTSWGLVFK